MNDGSASGCSVVQKLVALCSASCIIRGSALGKLLQRFHRCYARYCRVSQIVFETIIELWP